MKHYKYLSTLNAREKNLQPYNYASIILQDIQNINWNHQYQNKSSSQTRHSITLINLPLMPTLVFPPVFASKQNKFKVSIKKIKEILTSQHNLKVLLCILRIVGGNSVVVALKGWIFPTLRPLEMCHLLKSIIRTAKEISKLHNFFYL